MRNLHVHVKISSLSLQEHCIWWKYDPYCCIYQVPGSLSRMSVINFVATRYCGRYIILWKVFRWMSVLGVSWHFTTFARILTSKYWKILYLSLSFVENILENVAFHANVRSSLTKIWPKICLNATIK